MNTDYKKLRKALRGDAEQMEQHAVSFNIVRVIKDCRAAADAIEELQAEYALYKTNAERIVQMNSRLEAENARLKKRLALYESAEERGLLIRLPCPEGTPVYIILDSHLPPEHRTVVLGKFECRYREKFGKTVFLTREETEAAMAK